MRLQCQLSLQFPASDGYSLPSTERSSTEGLPLDGYTISASFNSAPVFIGRILGYCLVVSCPSTGSPSATVKVQGCVDIPKKNSLNEEQPDTGLVQWFDVALPDPRTNNIAVSQTISGASTAVFLETTAMYRWLRLVWTNSSGSALVTAHLEIKGIG